MRSISDNDFEVFGEHWREHARDNVSKLTVTPDQSSIHGNKMNLGGPTAVRFANGPRSPSLTGSWKVCRQSQRGRACQHAILARRENCVLFQIFSKGLAS